MLKRAGEYCKGTLSLSPRYTTFVTKIIGSLSLSTTFAVFFFFFTGPCPFITIPFCVPE